MSQPQRLSGSLELRYASFLKGLSAAKTAYDNWKKSITPVNIPVNVNVGGVGNSPKTAPAISRITAELALLRAEMVSGVSQTKALDSGYGKLGVTLSDIRARALALAQTQGASIVEVSRSFKLAADATKQLAQISGSTDGAKTALVELGNQAKKLGAELSQIKAGSSAADFAALTARVQTLQASFVALRPAVELDSKALATLVATTASLDRSMDGAQKRIGTVTPALNNQRSAAEKLVSVYRTLSIAIAAVGIERFLKFSKDAALDVAAITNQQKIFGTVLASNNQDVSKAEELVAKLAARFRTLPADIRPNITELIKLGANVDQVGSLLVGAGASAVSLGKQASSGFDAVTHAVATGTSAMLNQIGVQQDIGPATRAYARSIGKTVDALTSQERVQAAVNLILRATGADVATLEQSYAGLIGQQANANNAAKEAQRAFGQAITPAVIETTKLYTSLLKQITGFFVGADTREENKISRLNQLIKEQNEIIQFHIKLKEKSAAFPNPATLLVNLAANGTIDEARANLARYQKELGIAEADARRVKDLAGKQAISTTKKPDTTTILAASLKDIDRLQEKIENREVKAIPDGEAQKVAAIKESFADIFKLIQAIGKESPGLSGRLADFGVRAEKAQIAEIQIVRDEFRKKREKEALDDAQVAATAEQRANSARIAVLKDGSAKIQAEYQNRRAELAANFAKELSDVQGNASATARVTRAYQIERQALRQSEIKDLADFAKQSRDVVIKAETALETARIGAMKEGSAKIRAQFELDRKDLAMQLADALTLVTRGSNDEARVRAAFAGQLAALRLKTEREISDATIKEQKARNEKQQALNRSIIDQELAIARERAEISGSKIKVEQARYKARLVELDRFLNDARAKNKGNTTALEQIESLSFQQRELALKDHEKKITEIQAAAKLERVQKRTTTALVGVDQLDFAGVARVRAELDRLRKDSAGNAAAVKVVEDAFVNLEKRATTLRDQLAKVFEAIAANSKKLSETLLSLQDDPIGAERRKNQTLLDENTKFYDEQVKLAAGNREALRLINLAKAKDEEEIGRIAVQIRENRERDINKEIIDGSKRVAIQNAKNRGDDLAVLKLEAEEERDVIKKRYAKLIELADSNSIIVRKLNELLAAELISLDEKTAKAREKIFEDTAKKVKDYLDFLKKGAAEIAKSLSDLNENPIDKINADNAAAKNTLKETYAEQIELRKKQGLSVVELEQQLNQLLLLEDQKAARARLKVLKDEGVERAKLDQTLADLGIQVKQGAAAATVDPFDDLAADLEAALASVNQAEKELLNNEKLTLADRIKIQQLFSERRLNLKQEFANKETELVKKLKEDEDKVTKKDQEDKKKADEDAAKKAIELAKEVANAQKTLDSDRAEILKSIATLTASPFDDLAADVKSQLDAVAREEKAFLENENLTSAQRIQAQEVAAQKRELILANSARKQIDLEQDIVNAGVAELGFLRQSAEGLLDVDQARKFSLASLQAEISLRKVSVQVLQEQFQVGIASSKQLEDAKKKQIQTELDYLGALKGSITALEEQAKTIGGLYKPIQALSAALHQPIPDATVSSALAYANSLADTAQNAVTAGKSIADIVKVSTDAAEAFNNLSDMAMSLVKQDYDALLAATNGSLNEITSPKTIEKITRLAEKISKTFNIPFDQARAIFQNGLLDGAKELDFSNLKVRGVEKLQPVQDFLVNAAEKAPETLKKIQLTIADLETQLKTVQDSLIKTLSLDNVQAAVGNTVQAITDQLEAFYEPFASNLGTTIAELVLGGFRDGFTELQNFKVPPIKVKFTPDLTGIGVTASTGAVGVTNNYYIDGKTVGGAPLDVREALNTLKRFAQREVQAGTAVPG